MNLIQKPDVVVWEKSHYVFIEKIGPFQETAQLAWQTLHPLMAAISENNTITGSVSVYKLDPNPSKMIYRAGVALAEAPTKLPEGLRYEHLAGGRYVCFVLTGSYAQLPEACGQVFGIVAQKKIPHRDGFGIENYVNDPRTTPEAELITEILVPTV